MGSSHPEISMENLIDHIKGFVDMLVLACGYQSSGLPAIWDTGNIKKALNWGLYFEDMLKTVRISGKFEVFVKELDANLLKLASDSMFPFGLVHMSSATLSKARGFVLEHLLQIHPIKDEHFVAILKAVVELDIDRLSTLHNDCLKVFIDRLTLQIESAEFVSSRIGPKIYCNTSLLENDPSNSQILETDEQNNPKKLVSNADCKEQIVDDNYFLVLQNILIRQEVMTRASSIEKGLNVLSKIIIGNEMGSDNMKFEEKSADGALSDKDRIMELHHFGQWKSRSLSYFLDHRTIKLLSGAELIFQAPKEQWIQIFTGLESSIDPCYDNLLEIMEILLLGLILSKWNYLIQQVMSSTCDFLSAMKKLSDLQDLLQMNTLILHSIKENDILEHLTALHRSHPHKLWKLPSVLVAAAIPSWSALFRLHLSDVENHHKESYSASRGHKCNQHGSEPQDCQVNERIQSLYVFHIRCSS